MPSIARILAVLLLVGGTALASPVIGRANIEQCIYDKSIKFACSVQRAQEMVVAGPPSYPPNVSAVDFGAFLEDCCAKGPSDGSFFRKGDKPPFTFKPSGNKGPKVPVENSEEIDVEDGDGQRSGLSPLPALLPVVPAEDKKTAEDAKADAPALPLSLDPTQGKKADTPALPLSLDPAQGKKADAPALPLSLDPAQGKKTTEDTEVDLDGARTALPLDQGKKADAPALSLPLDPAQDKKTTEETQVDLDGGRNALPLDQGKKAANAPALPLDPNGMTVQDAKKTAADAELTAQDAKKTVEDAKAELEEGQRNKNGLPLSLKQDKKTAKEEVGLDGERHGTALPLDQGKKTAEETQVGLDGAREGAALPLDKTAEDAKVGLDGARNKGDASTLPLSFDPTQGKKGDAPALPLSLDPVQGKKTTEETQVDLDGARTALPLDQGKKSDSPNLPLLDPTQGKKTAEETQVDLDGARTALPLNQGKKADSPNLPLSLDPAQGKKADAPILPVDLDGARTALPLDQGKKTDTPTHPLSLDPAQGKKTAENAKVELDDPLSLILGDGNRLGGGQSGEQSGNGNGDRLGGGGKSGHNEGPKLGEPKLCACEA